MPGYEGLDADAPTPYVPEDKVITARISRASNGWVLSTDNFDYAKSETFVITNLNELVDIIRRAFREED